MRGGQRGEAGVHPFAEQTYGEPASTAKDQELCGMP